ncbi:HlyD family secretion protein [Pseudomonas sp. BGI-2]|uniref:HlyD family secretion protein n=1 Tax=Pseudomonas sp. BGI-2 TaxID=2528211 RepID=UPI001033E828|nr:HlyD family efflux transporter periplasmic adaptor subunit [Pseudomonas sp. BGI-2]TBN47178.1 HlyD family efflux transporter periplasmic adaptor subunit [Pseudomonas sp. BGI-2]
MSDALALFRSEVVSAKTKQRFGSVLIHQPWGYGVATILAGTLILVVVIYSYFGTYTRKATVGGLLMPEQGMLRLTSPTTGLLTEVFAHEGQTVGAGEDLFVISGERVSASGGTQQLIAEQLTQRLLVLERNRTSANDRIAGQVRLLDSRLVTITGELGQYLEEIRLIARRVDLSEIQHKRLKDLLAAGFISVAQYQQDEGERLALLGQQQSIQRARASLNREHMELQMQRQEVKLRHRNEIAEIDKGTSLVRQEQAENDIRNKQVSSAPFAGTITGLNIQVGQQVTAGALLASLIPQGADLIAHMYVASRKMGFIEKDQTVLIRYSAYPYQKFGMARGKIIDLAKSPYAIQELPAHIASVVHKTTEPTELFYRVTVMLDSQTINLYGNSQPLQAGMLLEADIVQDKRRLYEWALEPIYSITGKRSH